MSPLTKPQKSTQFLNINPSKKYFVAHVSDVIFRNLQMICMLLFIY
jgi:hypothetical protein